MINYYWRKFMRWLGYRRVFYRPSDKGLHMGDFWLWEYAPHTEERDYDESEWFRKRRD
jgi:hypothetical protein